MNKYIKKYYKLFVIAVIFVSLESICDLLQPNIISNIIDNGIAKNDISYILREGSKMFIVTIMGAIFALTRNIISINVSQNFAFDLRNDLFIKINQYSFKTIDKFNKASLITRITNDVNQLQNFVNGMMRIFIKAPILCIGSLVMAIKLNIQMSLIIGVIIIGVFLVIIANLKIGYPLFDKVQKSIDKLNSKVREYLGGVRVVKSFNRYHYEADKFDHTNEELYISSTKAMRTMSIFTPLITFIVNIGIIIVLYLGSIQDLNIKTGIIVAYINYMARILTSLIMISQIFNVFIRSKTSYYRVNEIIKENDNINTLLDDIDDIKSIEFNNVNFSYDKDDNKIVLKNINIKIEKNQTIGIIGSTGSGKTSIINLIPKFYEIDSGYIKINDIDINKVNEKSIRKKVAIVPQKNNLFTGSIIDNIRWGNEKASIEDVKKCLKISEAYKFINSFEDKYNTLLDQGGVNVSGGQKQRISIARAIIKNPSLLILDDATSALDLNTEVNIKNNFKKYLSNTTCILIAQRIYSVMDCDKIYVLDEGEIVGEGKHEDLINTCQVYKDIFKSQINRDVI